jgi:hypothetical protein
MGSVCISVGCKTELSQFFEKYNKKLSGINGTNGIIGKKGLPGD